MKKAFTMIELVFVIVVIGVLAAAIIPRIRTNPVQEAAIQLASHIKYTQHLAMNNDKYSPSRVDTSGSVIWYKDRWQIVFSSSQYTDYKYAYTIFSDDVGNGVSRGDAQEGEVAKNPQNSAQIMTGGYSSTAALDYKDNNFKGMKKLNLGASYGITSITLTGGCSGARVAFDHLGRPMRGDHNSVTSPYNVSNPYSGVKQRLITSNCNIEITDGSETVNIIIRPETGYTTIIF